MISFELAVHQMYIRILFMVCLILSAIFWLSAWAWAASVVSDFYNLVDGYHIGSTLTGYGASLAVATALGAINWYLTMFSQQYELV
jgi:hypothetical protein